MDSRLLLLLILGGVSTLFWFLFIKPDKAPSATRVSSRRGEKVRITFLHCWLFSEYPLTPFRKCPEHDGYLILTQAMQPLSTLLPVAHYKDRLETKGLHPIVKQHSGQTDWTLIITWGAILYTSYKLQITHDQARYWLLCQFYAAITKQDLTPIIMEEQEEDIEEPILIAEPVQVVMGEEEPQPKRLETSFEQAFYPLDVEETKEEPEPTLTELLGKDQEQFLFVLKNKLTRITTLYQHAGKITQPLLLKEILKPSEWRFLLNGEKGILWELGIVQRNDLGETVIAKDIDAAFSLVEAWSEAQEWGK